MFPSTYFFMNINVFIHYNITSAKKEKEKMTKKYLYTIWNS